MVFIIECVLNKIFVSYDGHNTKEQSVEQTKNSEKMFHGAEILLFLLKFTLRLFAYQSGFLLLKEILSMHTELESIVTFNKYEYSGNQVPLLNNFCSVFFFLLNQLLLCVSY